ncbi:hypothetical protein E2562_009195 [Oryza meyeriana var. granulata]|uniref:Uncharacterized protein n=1 Tax=Oryza meyeriana var. granulata TaxID=110450 RepID=A0A6G1D372_9ORYZ|nr:hypothetical protein E2562_009195 [Oryza meyeriana var. granulata]
MAERMRKLSWWMESTTVVPPVPPPATRRTDAPSRPPPRQPAALKHERRRGSSRRSPQARVAPSHRLRPLRELSSSACRREKTGERESGGSGLDVRHCDRPRLEPPEPVGPRGPVSSSPPTEGARPYGIVHVR